MTKLKQLVGEDRAIFASVLCLLSFVLLAPSAGAAEKATNVKYIDENGKEQTCAEAEVVTERNSRVTWNAGWYVVTNEVTVKGGANCSGAVHLILADTGALTISGVAEEKAGIGVLGANNLLAIYGQAAGSGALTVTGGQCGSGIGGDKNTSSSNITINGGKVTASGGYNGAGIGGGHNGSGSAITINGGTVTATGNNASAGIGGGCYKTGSYITINGGTVKATGGTQGGAGIGGGYNGSGSDITINGGMVSASGTSGAGIGGGYNNAGSKITIKAGTVTATGGNDGSSGIGGGQGGTASFITISGGAVTATGGSGAAAIGIGKWCKTPASKIYAADAVSVKAGDSADPTVEIMHFGTQDIAGDLAGKRYVTTEMLILVTVVVPEETGASAELFAFDVNGGWKTVASDAVPSNALVRVVWTAEDGKGLTGAGAANAYQWQATFVADKAEQTAPAPTVGEAGASVVTIGIDTRAKKSYFDAKDILPVWYEKGEDVVVQGQGQTSTDLVKAAANTNTVVWTPTEPNTYSLWYQGFFKNIFYTLPVEVTTNGLAVAGTTVAMTADGAAVEPQTEGELAGKLIVPSNSTVKVTYTAPEGKYFADGSSTYEVSFMADKSVNDAAAAIAGQKPEEPKVPSVKLGVVAQRYPWDGTVDVEYKAMNMPAKRYGLRVWVEIGGKKDSELVGGITTGVGTVAVDVKKMKFGEVKDDVKVTAELEDLPPQ